MLKTALVYIEYSRFFSYQHMIAFGLLPLMYTKSNLSDYLTVYVLFLFFYVYCFFINDYYDFDMDISANKKTFATLELIPLKAIRWLSISLITGSIALAYFLSSQYFYVFVIIVLLAWSYSSPPFRFKNRSWFEFPVVILAAGPLNYLYTFLIVGSTNYNYAVLNFMYIVAVIGQSQLNNCLKDFHSDKKSRSQNLAQKIGFRKAILLRKLLRLSMIVLLFGLISIDKHQIFISLLILLGFSVVTILDAKKDFADQLSSKYTILSSGVLILYTLIQSL